LETARRGNDDQAAEIFIYLMQAIADQNADVKNLYPLVRRDLELSDNTIELIAIEQARRVGTLFINEEYRKFAISKTRALALEVMIQRWLVTADPHFTVILLNAMSVAQSVGCISDPEDLVRGLVQKIVLPLVSLKILVESLSGFSDSHLRDEVGKILRIAWAKAMPPDEVVRLMDMAGVIE